MVPPELITSSLISASPKISKLGKNGRERTEGTAIYTENIRAWSITRVKKLSS